MLVAMVIEKTNPFLSDSFCYLPIHTILFDLPMIYWQRRTQAIIKSENDGESWGGEASQDLVAKTASTLTLRITAPHSLQLWCMRLVMHLLRRTSPKASDTARAGHLS